MTPQTVALVLVSALCLVLGAALLWLTRGPRIRIGERVDPDLARRMKDLNDEQDRRDGAATARPLDEFRAPPVSRR